MSAVAASGSTAVSQPVKTNKRLQLESLLREFQSKLGADWDTYHEALSGFLIGRLSRAELAKQIGPLMKNGVLHFHNKLLLLNFANALQDGPPEFSSELAGFWSKRSARSRGVKSSQYEKFKSNIMGLPLKERRRIRAITRDSGKKDRLSASVTLTRQAMLPKVPTIIDKDQQQSQVNNLVSWQQDVVNGINTPLATTSYELPDADTLTRRVLMTSREHGLTGGVHPRVFEVMALGLEAHLKNILESAIDTVRYRKRKYASHAFLAPGFPSGNGAGREHEKLDKNEKSRKRGLGESANESIAPQKTVVMSAEDLYHTLEMFPHLAEPGGPQYRLASVLLENDDADRDGLEYILPQRPDASMKDLRVVPEVSKNDPGSTEESSSVSLTTTTSSSSSSDDKTQGVTKNGNLAKEPVQLGSADELKWLLHDLISSPS